LPSLRRFVLRRNILSSSMPEMDISEKRQGLHLGL
jgi:hypothetical protein